MRRRLLAIALSAVLVVPAASASAATQSHSLRVGGSICKPCNPRAGGTWRVAFPGIKWVRTPSGTWTRRWVPRKFVWVRFH
jgi:opacity protein-like surface antigen